MVSEWLYTALVGAFALERLAELRVSNRNAARSLEAGGREHGRGHYPPMVALHSGLLAGCLAEVHALSRPFVPVLGAPMLALALASQGLRWWVIRTLGWSWTTRVIVVPGMERVRRGPFRWLRHPNYLAVAVEGAALPLVHGAWITALVFTALNAALMLVRIRCEEEALRAATTPSSDEAGAGS